MKLFKITKIVLLLCATSLSLLAQDNKKVDIGRLTGSLEANANFFERDSSIGAAGIPQYENLLYGAESWLQLNYSNNAWGLEAGLRFVADGPRTAVDIDNHGPGFGVCCERGVDVEILG